MHGELFAALIGSAAREISARHPDYFRHYPVAASPVAELAQECRAHCSLDAVSPDDLVEALGQGVRVLEELELPVQRECPTSEAISTMLMHSILDAYSACRGLVPLEPPPHDEPLEKVLERSYSVRRSASGVRYIFARGTQRPLLILSTTGAPLSIWTSLLRDRGLGRRCLVVESRGSPLIEGGTPAPSTLTEDAADIHEVLRGEQISEVDVLAWCNGARTAIALARHAPDRVTSLILLAPTFHGIDPKKYPSPFEDNLDAMYRALERYPQMGPYLMTSLTESGSSDISILKLDPQSRADHVLRLPPYECTRTLLAPLSNVEFFRNYMRRLRDDETHDLRGMLAEVRCPISLVLGTHDAAINTQCARDFLSEWGRDVVQVTLSAAGHHMHVLQYGYFRFVLNSLLAGRHPTGAMRVKVERLAVQ